MQTTSHLAAGPAAAPSLPEPGRRTRRLSKREILCLAAPDTAQVWDSTEDLPGGGDPALLAAHGAAAATALPPQLRNRLRRFAARGGPSNGLLIRGLLPDLPTLAATPQTPLPEEVGSDAQRAEIALLGAMSVLGEPFTFRSLYEGRLVQHVLPVPGHESAQTSGGSTAALDWHVEDAFSEDRCHYVGLLCLRGDPTAQTLFSTVRGPDLAPIAQMVLREPRFTVAPDLAHGSSPTGAPVAVLSGPPSDLRMRVDAIYMTAHRRDRQAKASLWHLHQALSAAAVGHVMEPGDLLILDNRRAAHARTSFPPRYDGTDRWLLRVMVCACPVRHYARAGARLI